MTSSPPARDAPVAYVNVPRRIGKTAFLLQAAIEHPEGVTLQRGNRAVTLRHDAATGTYFCGTRSLRVELPEGASFDERARAFTGLSAMIARALYEEGNDAAASPDK